jgi:alpha/beta superfamily hydrolase
MMIIEGSAGCLEALFADPTIPPVGITGIICHPHSLMGGTMQNKVVTTIARAFGDLGLRTIRFNFRGVGASEGVYDRGIGETEDLLAIINWVRTQRPEDKIWLAGFSFGAYVSLRAASQTTEVIEQLVSIAPPPMYTTQKLDIAFDVNLPRPRCPWLVVQGDADEVVVPQHVFDWIASMDNPPKLIRMPDATHFFHGRLVELREVLVEVLGRTNF